MGGKHKKSLRAEKAKVKLKSIKLPKGLNVTKTEFKVRKIVLKEQLHDDFNEEEGRRNINVKETLTKLKHHNTSMKMDALKKCKEIIEYHLDSVSRNLGDIIQALANISLDIENELRKEGLKQLSILLRSIPSSTAEPFFNILCSYLRCGMTHIQPQIQRDSLQFLDCLIQNLPSLIASRSYTIFEDFLDMISSSSKESRMLTLNVGKKVTSASWRTEVLIRVHSMLTTVILYKFKGTTSGSHSRSLRFDLNKSNYCDLINKMPLKQNNIRLFSNTSNEESSNETTKYRNFISQLVPLLFDSWIEVCPTLNSNNNGSIKEDIRLTYHSAFMLKTILEIFLKIWEIIDLIDKETNNNDLSNWFKNTYFANFKKHFLNMFPYKQGDSPNEEKHKSKLKNKKTEFSDGPECYRHNLIICILYLLFFKDRFENEGYNTVFLEYITKALQNSPSAENLAGLDEILKKIFLENEIFLTSFKQQLSIILEQVVLKMTEPDYFAKDIYHEIFIICCSLVSRKSEIYLFPNCSAFQNWLPTLTSLLLKPSISNRCLLTLTELAKQQNPIFLKSLKTCLFAVIDNIGTIQVIGSENQFEGKKMIMHLFYWLPGYSLQEQDEIFKKFESVNIKDKRIVPYFKSIIEMKTLII